MEKKTKTEKAVHDAKEMAKEILNYLSDKEYKSLDVEIALGIAYTAMLAFNSMDEETIFAKLGLIRIMALGALKGMKDHEKTEGENTD